VCHQKNQAQGILKSVFCAIPSAGSVAQIAGLLRAGADDDTLAAAWVPLVCSRLIGGNDVPVDVTKAARSCLNTPADILRYNAGNHASGVPLVVERLWDNPLARVPHTKAALRSNGLLAASNLLQRQQHHDTGC
jgi:hypothetical protein